jgi:hypothetical protein
MSTFSKNTTIPRSKFPQRYRSVARNLTATSARIHGRRELHPRLTVHVPETSLEIASSLEVED